MMKREVKCQYEGCNERGKWDVCYSNAWRICNIKERKAVYNHNGEYLGHQELNQENMSEERLNQLRNNGGL